MRRDSRPLEGGRGDGEICGRQWGDILVSPGNRIPLDWLCFPGPGPRTGRWCGMWGVRFRPQGSSGEDNLPSSGLKVGWVGAGGICLWGLQAARNQGHLQARWKQAAVWSLPGWQVCDVNWRLIEDTGEERLVTCTEQISAALVGLLLRLPGQAAHVHRHPTHSHLSPEQEKHRDILISRLSRSWT